MLIFIGCFPKKKKEKENNLSLMRRITLINIIFFFCLGNNIFFHAFSLSHNNSKEHFLENNLIFRCLVMTLKMSLRIFSSVWYAIFFFYFQVLRLQDLNVIELQCVMLANHDQNIKSRFGLLKVWLCVKLESSNCRKLLFNFCNTRLVENQIWSIKARVDCFFYRISNKHK